MFDIGIPEIVIIALAFAILFFGSKKILEFSRSLGRMSGEFKKGKAEIERELRGEATLAAKDTEKDTAKDA